MPHKWHPLKVQLGSCYCIYWVMQPSLLSIWRIFYLPKRSVIAINSNFHYNLKPPCLNPWQLLIYLDPRAFPCFRLFVAVKFYHTKVAFCVWLFLLSVYRFIHDFTPCCDWEIFHCYMQQFICSLADGLSCFYSLVDVHNQTWTFIDTFCVPQICLAEMECCEYIYPMSFWISLWWGKEMGLLSFYTSESFREERYVTGLSFFQFRTN